MKTDWFGEELRKKAGQRSGRIPDGRRVPDAPARPADAAQEAPVEPVEVPGGIGGGLQDHPAPPGESFGDEVRRRVFGG